MILWGRKLNTENSYNTHPYVDLDLLTKIDEKIAFKSAPKSNQNTVSVCDI